MANSENALRIAQLDWRDKCIHRAMANAHTQMCKVVAELREHKAERPDWMMHAAEMEGAAEILTGWMYGIRLEAANAKQEGKHDVGQ